MKSISFLITFLTLIAYEAIRVSGEHNFRVMRLKEEHTYLELFINNWQAGYLVAYFFIVLSTLIVLLSTEEKPKVQKTWLAICTLILMILLYNVPGANEGRYGSTIMNVTIFYCLVLPIPSIILIIFGTAADRSNKSKHADSENAAGV